MLVVVIVAVAVAAVLGWVGGRQLAPEPLEEVTESPRVTTEVRREIIQSSIVTRGTAEAAASMSLPIRAEGTVTALPSPGDVVAAGDVVASVDYRPVIVLRGELPVAADLTTGSFGPGVLAFERAVAELGYDPGPVDQRFDDDTARSVVELYLDRGHVPTTSDPLTSEEQGLAATLSSGDQDDRETLEEAVLDRGPIVAASELVMVDELPVRVQQVQGQVGLPVPPDAVVVSSANVQVVAAVPASDATQVDVEMEVVVDDPGVLDPVDAVVVAKEADPEQAGAVRLTIGSDVGLDVPVGSNVRVTIPTATSDGDVLAVPLAAVGATNDSGGVLRVVDGEQVRTVRVQLGVAADGLVEVHVDDGDLDAGDLVIIGDSS